MINSLFESMLQRQSGIVFYIVFIALFATILPKQSVQQLEPEA
jgi:hypothetical protein